MQNSLEFFTIMWFEYIVYNNNIYIYIQTVYKPLYNNNDDEND